SEDGGIPLWTDAAISIWDIPNNPFGRMILLGFAAVVFAGEYQWRTWKNIVPRNRRAVLLLMKFIALGVFVVVAFVLMSIIWSIGWGVLAQIAGVDYGPAITGQVLADFAQDYTKQASLTFTSTMIAAGYAALAGMVTRSILGGVLVSFGITLFEGGLILGLMLIGWLLDIPRIVHIYQYMPFYNMANVTSWINDHVALAMRPYGEDHEYSYIVFSDSLAFSLIVLAVWVIGLYALIAYLFQRQDITT
ncbi:MAG: hypothetical protein JXA10_00040, partial [Anaerolineae bacterium]|nr:hypothetical protein [Anaerolineae bacterium]